ncbi:putative SP-containing protein [Vairimorpha necatrix]|uniref:SP-containing protein n=1 Tax=Vairimorpha necatrix TaxID=6039 RepID=A0AAX4JEU4_9MICR
MLFFIFHLVAITCTDHIFVVPYHGYANVYISLNHEDLPGTYIISELNDKDCLEQTEQYYFKPITLEEKANLEQYLCCAKLLNWRDADKVKLFLNSDYVAIAKIKLHVNKNYFLDVMKSKSLVTVDTFMTSKILNFTDFFEFYSLKCHNLYDCKRDLASSEIPLLYLKNVLFRSSFKAGNKNRTKSETTEQIKIKKDNNIVEKKAFNCHENMKSKDYISIEIEIANLRNDYEFEKSFNKTENQKSEAFNFQKNQENAMIDTKTAELPKKLYCTMRNIPKETISINQKDVLEEIKKKPYKLGISESSNS